MQEKESASDRPWADRWRMLKALDGGGQGDTFLVEPVDGSPTQAVMKLLKSSKSKDPKARARMHREVASLKTLAPAGAKVPRVQDSNTEDFEKLDVPLYFVMDFVDGKTLRELIDLEGTLAVNDGVEIALDLCTSLRLA